MSSTIVDACGLHAQPVVLSAPLWSAVPARRSALVAWPPSFLPEQAFCADPLQWAQRAVTISQFTSKLWTSTVLPGGTRGIPLGNLELSIRGFPNHFWSACPGCSQIDRA